MKKILSVIIVLSLMFIFSFYCEAATWKFEWNNTTIHIPVGDSLDNYKNKPKAFLYKDGKLLKDAQITYSNELYLGLSIDLVDTNRVGIYNVWYRAFEEKKYQPGTCTGYRTKVSFIVEDTIAPTLDLIDKMIFIKRGETSFDFSSYVNAYDNYSDCEIVFSHNINFLRVGVYAVNVSAIDSSGNRTTGIINVRIYENEGPRLETSIEGNYLEVPYNSKVSLSSYFTAIDPIDGDLSNEIVYPTIDTSELGQKEYVISVSNKANIETTYILKINVVDNQAPEIVLTGNSYILDYNTDLELFDFMGYIKYIDDNSEIDYDNLTITHNIENKVGSYSIWYEYSDGVFTTINEVKITMLSSSAPTITTTEAIANVGDNIDYSNYYTIADLSDPNILDSVKIDDSNVDYSKPGVYYATVYAINSSGLSQSQRIKVVINDNSIKSNNSYNIASIIAPIGLSVALVVVVSIIFIFKRKKKV